jgi:hypothetical protein
MAEDRLLSRQIEGGSQMPIEALPDFIRQHYETHEWKHAIAILQHDFLNEWNEIMQVLTDFRLRRNHIEAPGGGKSPIANALDSSFFSLGWQKKRFHTSVVVDGENIENPTHEIDCYKSRVALEVEWNNKDPFFDRDLNNFRVLFELRAISVGVIITRCDELQEIFDSLGKGRSYGQSTTHMSRLLSRAEGSGGGGCPLLVFGITRRLYVEE